MAFYLINIIRSENDYVTGIPVVYGHFECDTVSDLPAQNQTTYKIGIGSTAHIIDTNAEYAITSGGTWYVQETGVDVYTKAQTDALLLTKANAADVYTKTQTDALLLTKANAADVYTKTQTDNLLSPKITISDVFGIGTAIETGVDINDLKTRGLYTCTSLTIANTLVQSSLPVTGTTFRLEVKYINNNTRIRQEFYPLSNVSEYYARTLGTTNTWQSWYKFMGVQV